MAYHQSASSDSDLNFGIRFARPMLDFLTLVVQKSSGRSRFPRADRADPAFALRDDDFERAALFRPADRDITPFAIAELLYKFDVPPAEHFFDFPAGDAVRRDLRQVVPVPIEAHCTYTL